MLAGTAVLRLASLLLAIALLVGMTQHQADEDDLRRGLTPSQRDTPLATVDDNGPGDQDRLARQFCSIQADDLLASFLGCPRTLSLARAETNPPPRARKLYELKTVLLI